MANDILDDLDVSSTNSSANSKEPPKIQKIGGGEFEKFAKSVIEVLIKDNVPPIPINYQIYFSKHLEDNSITMTFKKRIHEMMESEEKEDNKIAFLEGKVKRSFNSLTRLLQDIAMIYKNTEVMKELLKKRQGELSVNSNNLIVDIALSSLQADLDRFVAVLEKYSHAIKMGFEEVSHCYKSIEENSEFDSVFGVYNKKFLMMLLERCKEGFLKYNYQNSLALFRVKKDDLNELQPRDRIIVLKNIAKVLSKDFQKANIVAHYEDGIFAILLQHTNLNDSQVIIEGIIDQINNTNFFMSGTKVDVDLQACLAPIANEADLSNYVENLVKALDRSGKDKEKLVVLGT